MMNEVVNKKSLHPLRLRRMAGHANSYRFLREHLHRFSPGPINDLLPVRGVIFVVM